MTKKKNNKVKKLLKQQQLQQLSSSATVEFSLPTNIAAQAILPDNTKHLPELPADNYLKTEIVRSLVSLGFIIILLVTAIIIDNKTNYFSNFGHWLFRALRLNN